MLNSKQQEIVLARYKEQAHTLELILIHLEDESKRPSIEAKLNKLLELIK